ncbi:MAG: hypothetical protein Q4E63_08790 [Prevotellaceae bacterium]|nr:hypothetical protein [Prevotellaceae bacterium]
MTYRRAAYSRQRRVGGGFGNDARAEGGLSYILTFDDDGFLMPCYRQCGGQPPC